MRAPDLPTLVMLVTGAAAMAAAVYLTWRRLQGLSPAQARALLALRVVLLALLLLAVLNPALTQVVERSIPASIAVAVDVSKSMTGLPLGGKSRYATALAALRGGPLAERLRREAAEYYALDGGARRVSALDSSVAGAEGTDLQAGLSEILRRPRRQPLVACLLISDGADTTGEGPARIAEILRAYGVPVYCLGVGSARPIPDVAIAGLVHPRSVKEGDQIRVRARVTAPGFEGQELEVALTPERGSAVRRKLAAGEQDRRVKLSMTASAPGYHRYVLSAQEAPGEITSANNRRAFFVRVEPTEARLLLIEGQPRREYAFLRRMLLRIPDLETVILLRKKRPAQFWLDAEQPKRAPDGLAAAGELGRFRAVVLSNVDAAALGHDYLRRLADFVYEGGALAMLGGPDSFGAGGYADGPLAKVLPVRVGAGEGLLDNPVRPRLRTEGELGRALADAGAEGWNRLPFLAGMNAVAGPSAGAEVALEASEGARALGPMLVAARVGVGRTLALTVSDTYRWQQSPNADERSRAAYQAFWRTLVGWLITLRPEKQVVLELDRDVYELGQLIRIRVHVLSKAHEPVTGARVEVRLEGSSDTATHLAQPSDRAGTYQLLLPAQVAGSYVVTATAKLGGATLGTDRGKFEVIAPVRELTQGRARPEVLKAIAAATGGKYLPIERAGERVEQRHIELRPARTWPFFLLVLAVAASEWMLRRRWGIG